MQHSHIDNLYFIVLTNITGGFTATLSFVSAIDQDGLSITCEDLTDETTATAQLSIISKNCTYDCGCYIGSCMQWSTGRKSMHGCAYTPYYRFGSAWTYAVYVLPSINFLLVLLFLHVLVFVLSIQTDGPGYCQ